MVPASALSVGGCSSPDFAMVMLATLASLANACLCRVTRALSSATVLPRISPNSSPGGIFDSLRIVRTATMMDFSHSISASASPFISSWSASGHWASMIESPLIPSLGATFCQISSVINGINGCISRRMVSSTSNSVRRVPCRSSFDDGSSHKTGLDSSKYQSQYSFHTKS